MSWALVLEVLGYGFLCGGVTGVSIAWHFGWRWDREAREEETASKAAPAMLPPAAHTEDYWLLVNQIVGSPSRRLH